MPAMDNTRVRKNGIFLVLNFPDLLLARMMASELADASKFFDFPQEGSQQNILITRQNQAEANVVRTEMKRNEFVQKQT